MLEFSEESHNMDCIESASAKLQQSLTSIIDSFLNPLSARLKVISDSQSTLSERLNKFSNYLKNSPEIMELQEISISISIYSGKLAALLVAMKRIGDRCLLVQARVNKLRKHLPNGPGFKERGVFFYRCCYPGGIMVRVEPSVHAVQSGVLIPFGEVVEAFERVFMNGDSSVYVHMVGGGWLFENIKDLQCLVRCSELEKMQECITHVEGVDEVLQAATCGDDPPLGSLDDLSLPCHDKRGTIAEEDTPARPAQEVEAETHDTIADSEHSRDEQLGKHEDESEELYLLL